jgi:hypothetical protein
MKRNLKQTFLMLLTCLSASTMNAQDELDALRYGYTNYFGTSRSIGIGNAMGSIGADFGSLSINPAGIGQYRRGDFAITPSFSLGNTKGAYLNNVNEANSSQFNFSHMGIVFTQAKRSNSSNKGGWRAASLAFGMNRVANFNREYTYGGVNTKSSFVEKFAEEFNRNGGMNSNSLGNVSYPAFAAYETYLVDKDFTGDTALAKAYVPYADGIYQQKRVVEKGGMHEFVISGGGNYMDKLMLGATLGITRSNYTRTMSLSEEDQSNNTSNDFKYVRFNEYLTTEGTGVNLKLGAIFKPVEAFRLGLAVHTPTRIMFNDMFNIDMESHTDSLKLRNNPGGNPITQYRQDTAQVFNYSLNTPYRAILSGAVLFKQYGFITADIEYVGYNAMKYDYGIGYESASATINDVISSTYKNAVNVRVGAELKLKDFALRGGYAMYGSPFKNNTTASRNLVSGGVGYRAKNWYLDAALQVSSQKASELPYTLSRANAQVTSANLTTNQTQLLVTVGRRF